MFFFCCFTELCCSDGWRIRREGWRRTDGRDARTNGERAMMRPTATANRPNNLVLLGLAGCWAGRLFSLRFFCLPPIEYGEVFLHRDLAVEKNIIQCFVNYNPIVVVNIS